MGRATVRDADKLIAKREIFDAGNLRAQTWFSGYGWLTRSGWWEAEGYSPQDAKYIVYSYDTPIAWEVDKPSNCGNPDHDDEKVIIVPEIKYSVTTTRHQNRARMGFGHRTPKPDTYLVDHG